MSEIQFDHGNYVHLLWLIPLLAAVTAYGFWRKKLALAAFASVNLLSTLMPRVSIARQYVKTAMLLTALVFVVLALTGPRWGVFYEEVERKGVDIVVALDVSRSMLAEDIAPNRLERAKLAIGDLLDQLDGDRIGLVTFSGAAVKKCPLTVNYGSFKLALDEVDVQSSPRGGTMLGDAVRKAKECFLDKIKDHKAVIVISDGEETELDYPAEAAQSAYEKSGVIVCTVGIGDVTEGARIPVEENGRRTYLQHDGQEVWSKMNPSILQEMAVVAGGKYLPAETRDFDLGELYNWIRGKLEVVEFDSRFTERRHARFQWLLAPALVLLLIETLMTDRKRSRVSGEG